MAEHPIQGLMNVTMDKIRQMADSNTMITASVASQLISSRDHGPGSRWNTETGSFLFLRMVAISSFSPLFVQYPALCPQRTKARASARPHTPSAHSQ